jgi:hypothetical protein
MKAYFINAREKTITAFDYGGNWRDIPTKIGCLWLRSFSLWRYAQDGIYYDAEPHPDEATHPNGSFYVTVEAMNGSTAQKVIFGNGVVLGEDDDGTDVAVNMDIETLSTLISFPD